ncbi:MAG TPA: sodium:proton antiporter [Xanthomonadales bacterium]|nr:sodium:proton antiporter [Xanthomonadales bacterium]
MSLLLGLGVVCQWLAWRMRIAAILPLLLVGLLLGPGMGVLDPDQFLGDLLFPIVSLGVAIILFEGSLTLRFSDIQNVTGIIRNLTSIGVLVTWGVMGAAAHYVVGLSWQLSLLFGALVSVTGPTVIMPMLRSIKPTSRIANILRWEGILVDPIGAVLAVLLFELIVSGHQSQSWMEFGKVIMMGSVWGISGGVVLGNVLKRHLLPDYLENYAAMAMVLVVFASSNSLGQESGLIAVTVMGIVLANMRDLNVEELLSFKEHLTVVLISMLFIILAARLDVEQIALLSKSSLIILAVALFLARPLSVLFSSIGTSISFREGALLAWIAPRGIVAAAVSSLFALKLEGKVENAELIVPLTFMVIIGTVMVQGLTAPWLARRLGLSSSGEQGVMFSTADRVGLAIGEALHANGIKVLLADSNRAVLKQARMMGLNTYFGNPLSEHADRFMDLAGYTELLAMSRNAEANAMVCAHFRHDFGSKHVYSIKPANGEEDSQRKEMVHSLRGNILFSNDATWTKLASMLGQGAKIRTTQLTDEFDFEAYRIAQSKGSVIMFAINDKGRLKVFSSREQLLPESGWKVIALTLADEGESEEIVEQEASEELSEE